MYTFWYLGYICSHVLKYSWMFYMCVCVYACECVWGVCPCLSVGCTCRHQRRIFCVLYITLHLISLREGLSLNLEQTGSPSDLPISASKSSGVTDVCTTIPGFINGRWGSNSCPQQHLKHFYLLSHFLISRCSVFYLKTWPKFACRNLCFKPVIYFEFILNLTLLCYLDFIYEVHSFTAHGYHFLLRIVLTVKLMRLGYEGTCLIPAFGGQRQVNIWV